jgi:hypothetical protein
MRPDRILLPLREKVSAKPTDEGSHKRKTPRRRMAVAAFDF